MYNFVIFVILLPCNNTHLTEIMLKQHLCVNPFSPTTRYTCVSSMHACWIYLHSRVNRMSQKTTRGTHVLVLCMLNQPAIHVESTCIRVLIEVPENNTGYTCVGTVHVESTCYTCWIYLHSCVNRMSQKRHGHTCVTHALCWNDTCAVKHAC